MLKSKTCKTKHEDFFEGSRFTFYSELLKICDFHNQKLKLELFRASKSLGWIKYEQSQSSED